MTITRYFPTIDRTGKKNMTSPGEGTANVRLPPRSTIRPKAASLTGTWGTCPASAGVVHAKKIYPRPGNLMWDIMPIKYHPIQWGCKG